MADRFLELFPFVIQFGISDDLEGKMGPRHIPSTGCVNSVISEV